jgi:protein O-GlcNAc transferase
MMSRADSTPKAALPVEIVASRHFLDWLGAQQISLTFTTYQSSRLMLLGVSEQGQMSGFERIFDRAMGLYATPERIYLSSKYQLWQLDNVLSTGQRYNGYDKLFIPRLGYTTGDLDIHDLVVTTDGNQIVFISSLLNCLATMSDRHSCCPLWTPPFISSLVNEDRCHLNGLALVDGKPRYVTACSQSDVVDGWRDRRETGGCVLDIESEAIIATGLSMPHSPRFYQGRLWLLNSGSGEFGYLNIDSGQFEAVTFCPGFLRGLAFVGNYAIVGLSKPRHEDKTFSGLKLDQQLTRKQAEPRCGLMVIDLSSGAIIHWLRLEGEVSELYDVQVLVGVQCPMALGFQTEEIAQLITLDPRQVSLGQIPRSSAQQSTHPSNVPPATGAVAQALLDRSRLLKQQGEFSAAAEVLREAIRLQPDCWVAHNNLGTLLQQEGLLQEAEQCYESALSYHPQFAEAMGNRASIWQLRGELERAKPGLIRSLQLKPDYVHAHINLANLYKQRGRLAAAIDHFQRAVALDSQQADAYFQLAQIYEYQEKLDEALQCYQQILNLTPSAQEIKLFISFNQLQQCDWQNYDQRVQDLQAWVKSSLSGESNYSLSPYVLNFFPVPLDLHQAMAQQQAERLIASAQGLLPLSTPANVPRTPDKLRLGYLSPDFRDHAVGRLIYQLFRIHDRSKFEVYAYATTDVFDVITEQVQAGSDSFVNLSLLSTQAAAQRIRDDGIDILIDLAGYTIGNGAAILALQPAPIQAQFLGYPDTLGAPFVQYSIADTWLIPPAVATRYTEDIIYLPTAFVSSSLEVSSRPMSRQEFGLPSVGTVFACFNTHRKICPEVFDAWMAILQQVPNSVLWLLEGVGQTLENLRREAAQRGIEPDRLIFRPRLGYAEYLAGYQFADLFLDTFIYSAGSTAIAALWSGVPVLTKLGQTNASRMGSSICAAAGLEALICPTATAYIEQAVYLANHPQDLTVLHQYLQAQRDRLPLFDLPRFTRSLEAALQHLSQSTQSSPGLSLKGRLDPS